MNTKLQTAKDIKVKDLILRKNVLVLHCMSKISPSSEIPANITLQKQYENFKMGYIEKPCSCCTFKLGQDKLIEEDGKFLRNIFQPLGFILKDGLIVRCGDEDIGTVGGKSHLGFVPQTIDSLDSVIGKREGHNELSVLSPKEVAFFYIEYTGSFMNYSYKEVMDFSINNELPLYIIRNENLILKWDSIKKEITEIEIDWEEFKNNLN